MRFVFPVAAVLACAAQLCHAQSTAAAPEPQTPPSTASDSKPQLPLNGVCLFTGTPPAELTYVAVKQINYKKGSYGSVNDVLPRVVADAKASGADAVIRYNGAQHFGFFPWRMVRPVVTGTAIKWTPARTVDCAAAGGVYTTGTLADAPPPPPRK